MGWSGGKAIGRESMQSVIISVAVGLLTFAMGLVGLYLKRRLPERHMSMGSRDMIGAIMGLLSLLLALVLGILVGSAHSFFASQEAELESLGSRSLELELAFRQYGPETEPLRQMMKASVQEAYEAAQGNQQAYAQHFEIGDYLSKFEKWNDMVASLSPHTAQQTELLSSIRSVSASFQQTRLLMSEQLASSISWPLVVIVVGWALLLFCGFGVMSDLNLTSVVALASGAFAVATAIFLILELNRPFSGLIHVPTMSIEATLRALETPPAKR
jgi:ABC-type multidrug transport system fused ATPase/permease subunit